MQEAQVIQGCYIMRLYEFVTAEDLAMIKFQLEKTFHALVVTAKKDQQRVKNAKEKAMRDKESKFTKKLRKKHGISAFRKTSAPNTRPKR